MEAIPLKTIELITFDKSNLNHVAFVKELIHDKSILKWFQGLSASLLHNYRHEFFELSFLVGIGNKLVGFINIGSYNIEEKCVYLRYSISLTERQKGYGKTLLSEITDYIFNNYLEVESIRLKNR